MGEFRLGHDVTGFEYDLAIQNNGGLEEDCFDRLRDSLMDPGYKIFADRDISGAINTFILLRGMAERQGRVGSDTQFCDPAAVFTKLSDFFS